MKLGKKVLALSMSALIAFGAVGCGEKKDDGKVSITISDTPNETQTEKLELHNKQVADFEAKNPNIKIVSDSTSYADSKIFTVTAAAQQLPTLYISYYTDSKMRTREGYAADITDYLKKNKLLDKINPALIEFVTGDDGRIYGIPREGYAMGLSVNKDLFTKAGLVNEDGTVKAPKTYEEMAEYAKIIKEKTGVAGIAFCTINNCGGWHFMNIAWSYGVNFMEKTKDGKYKATFNTPEAVEALEYIKDLKWKHNVLHENSVVDQNELYKLFGTGQAAMIFAGPADAWSKKFGMNLANISTVSVPAGPKGRYAQTGGTAIQFEPGITDDELDAVMKWLDYKGNLANYTDEQAKNTDETYKLAKAENGIIIPRTPFPIWVDSERNEIVDGIRAKYANVDIKDFENYLDFSQVTLRPEEPVCAQELYAVLDKIIQEVINNKNADCKALIEKANNDFQLNHLDKQ